MTKLKYKILVLVHNKQHTFGFGETISEAKDQARKYLEDGFRFSTANHRIWLVGLKTVADELGNVIPGADDFIPIDIT